MPTRSGLNYLANIHYVHDVDRIDNIRKSMDSSSTNNQSNQSNSSGNDVKPPVSGSSTTVKPFTLGPSRDDKEIDYSTTEGIKQHARATGALKDDFDGKADGSAVFKMQLSQRARTEGWANGTKGDIINIPLDGLDASQGTADVIREKSQLSKDVIKTWANDVLIGKGVDRRAQNNENMVLCLQNSLTKPCLARIDLMESEYTIKGIIVAALLYKVIMEQAEMDTMVTSALIRKRLQNLKCKMRDFRHDIQGFTNSVRNDKRDLELRGETTDEGDLCINLLEAFQCADDQRFREEFSRLEHKYMIRGEKLSSEELLHKADMIFNVRTQNHTWGQRSHEEEKIIAMQAEFKDMNLKFEETKQKYKKLKHEMKSGGNSGSSSNRRRGRRPVKEVASWKFENPDNAKKMKKDGKTYHWCLNHNEGKGMWTLHHPDNCQNKNKQDSDEQVMAAAYDSDTSEESI